jgi:hypothetical protein
MLLPSVTWSTVYSVCCLILETETGTYKPCDIVWFCFLHRTKLRNKKKLDQIKTTDYKYLPGVLYYAKWVDVLFKGALLSTYTELVTKDKL